MRQKIATTTQPCLSEEAARPDVKYIVRLSSWMITMTVKGAPDRQGTTPRLPTQKTLAGNARDTRIPRKERRQSWPLQTGLHVRNGTTGLVGRLERRLLRLRSLHVVGVLAVRTQLQRRNTTDGSDMTMTLVLVTKRTRHSNTGHLVTWIAATRRNTLPTASGLLLKMTKSQIRGMAGGKISTIDIGHGLLHRPPGRAHIGQCLRRQSTWGHNLRSVRGISNHPGEKEAGSSCSQVGRGMKASI